MSFHHYTVVQLFYKYLWIIFYSLFDSLIPHSDVPETPVGIKVTDIASRSVTLEWSSNSLPNSGGRIQGKYSISYSTKEGEFGKAV